MVKIVIAIENLLYLIGGVFSISLFHKAMEYAQSQRVNPYAIGGEIFVPVIAYIIIYTLIRCVSRNIQEMIEENKDKKENNPFKYKATVAIINIDKKGKCKVTNRDGNIVKYTSFEEYIKTL
jgi:hypothetical protein